jgi:hypothetical protein
MSSNPTLTRIKLTAHDAILTERTADLFADLTNGAVRVELLANCAR